MRIIRLKRAGNGPSHDEEVRVLCRRIERREKMKNYLVTVNVDGTVTNRLIRASSPEEAEKEALECASQETTDLQAPS